MSRLRAKSTWHLAQTVKAAVVSPKLPHTFRDNRFCQIRSYPQYPLAEKLSSDRTSIHGFVKTSLMPEFEASFSDIRYPSIEPLRAFLLHEHPVIDAPKSHQRDTAANSTESSDTDQAPNGSASRKSSAEIPMEPALSSTYDSTGARESKSTHETEVYVRTKYNVQAKLNNLTSQVLNITLLPSGESSIPEGQVERVERASAIQQTQSNKSIPIPSNSNQPEKQYRYRLFPDWQTSYLWYDISWPGNPTEDPVVEIDEIEQRYPALFPFYLDWLERNESQLDKLFSGSETVVDSPWDLQRSVGWEINGFLMSCWLALQTDVHSVEFIPSDTKYEIKSGTMELEFQRFLGHKSDQLRKTFSAVNGDQQGQ